MAGYLAMFLLIVMFITAWPFVAQAKMLAADCTFGKVHTTEAQNMSATLIGKLPEDKHMSHSCVVKTDGVNHHKHFFQVKAKRNKESKGFLHVSAYETDESQLLGHLDVSKSKGDWSSLTLCPPRYNNGAQDKYLSFSGTPNLTFTIQIDSSPQEIKLNEPITKVVSSGSVRVFQFIPAEDISNTQLDVTVTSESANVPAYLKVSRDCKDVKDNIDVVDYKGESLRLSFAKKGRITLSKVSIPPLINSTSSWFIGIGIKNATGNTPSFVTKAVTLELSKSFDYSYSYPILMLLLASVGSGIGVSVFALCCFQGILLWTFIKEKCTSTGNNGTQPVVDEERGEKSSSTTNEHSHLLSKQNPDQKTKPEPIPKTKPEPRQKTKPEARRKKKPEARPKTKPEARPKTKPEARPKTKPEPRPKTKPEARPKTSPKQDQNQNQNPWCLVFKAWFEHGPKRYSHITAIVGFVMMVGAGQFVFANWYLMQQEGDRDNCYYNDFCYRVSLWHDIPLNLMISNLVYMIHGLILALAVYWMEVSLPSHAHDRSQAFSIGYAFAWALVFEGSFSLVYHLCPSKLTFQFDTAFMFVIAGLTVILLYNGIEMKERPGDEGPVGSGSFFLYFLVPLYIFNYLGTLRPSDRELYLDFDLPFFFFLCGWLIFLSVWTGRKLGIRKEHGKGKIWWFGLGVAAPVLLFLSWIIGLMNQYLPQVFLMVCVANSSIASLGTICFRVEQFNCPCKYPEICERRECNRRRCLIICNFIYFFGMVVVWIFAVCFFMVKETTDKVKTPEASRDLNQECEWLGFFDSHDIWHILSSNGLLLMVYFVMFLSSGSLLRIWKSNETKGLDGGTSKTVNT